MYILEKAQHTENNVKLRSAYLVGVRDGWTEVVSTLDDTGKGFQYPLVFLISGILGQTHDLFELHFTDA